VNAYLLPGPPVTLVDCGPKTPDARAALDAGLARAGLSLDRIERLVITHGHVDHFGLAAAVAAAGGARVMVHAADRPKLIGDGAFMEPMREFICASGFPGEVADTLIGVFMRYREDFDPVEPTDLLSDGDRLPLGDSSIDVLHTPGHAEGHICLWDGRTLISGDVLLEEISPNPVIEFAPDGRRHRTLPALLRSLRRIEALRPRVAYPGHGEMLSAPVQRAAALLRHHEERKAQLALALAAREWTLRELVESWFPGLDRFGLVLGMSEIIGHLDLLEEDGRLAVDQRNGVAYYSGG
jgi:glyoxylase-like metal-dependent hydrolase (beta-lactamase superfamily II)